MALPRMSLSVVMPTYGRRHRLSAVIPAILAEPDLAELVVVVDGFDAGSETLLGELAKRDQRLRTIFQEKKGRTAARQHGSTEATGQLLLFLDDDVMPDPGFARKHAEYHRVREDLVVVGAMRTDPPDWNARARLYDRSYQDHVKMWERDPANVLEHFWGGHFSIRRIQFDRVGGFAAETALGYHEDFEFGRRCAAAGLHGCFVSDIGARHLYERSRGGLLRDAVAQGRDSIRLESPHFRRNLQSHTSVGRLIQRLAVALPETPRRRLLVSILWCVDQIDRPATARFVERITEAVANVERYATATGLPLGSPDRRHSVESTTHVGVVVPAHNGGPYLWDTLMSLTAQEHRRWSAVVVDDGSTDDTHQVAKAAVARDPRITIVRQRRAGVAAARTAGLRQLPSSCSALLFLDADDVLDPRMLRRLVLELDTYPQAAMAHCGWRYIDASGAVPRKDPLKLLPRFGPRRGLNPYPRLPDRESETPFAAILCGAGLAPSLALIRRSHFEKAGGWRTDIGQPCEDTDLFLELALVGSVRWVPDKLVSYRAHPEQSTADEAHLHHQWARLFARWADVSDRPEDQRRAIVAAWRWRRQRYLPFIALRDFPRRVRAGRPVQAARHLAGALRAACNASAVERKR